MRYLFILMRYSISESYKCRLILLYFIVVLIKLLRGLSLESFNEYISTQHAPVI